LRWVREAIPILALRLPKVKELVLHGVNIKEFDKPGETAFMLGFREVEHLKLYSTTTTFGSVLQCARVLASFPLLKSFSCETHETWEEHGIVKPDVCPSYALQALSLRPAPFKRAFLSWLLNSDVPPHIEYLYLWNLQPAELVPVGAFLNRVSPTLQNLTLQAGSDEGV
jgi:hypothetical protein